MRLPSLDSTRLRTVLSAVGTQLELNAAVSPSTSARRVRLCPLMVVKSPPMYRRLPDTASVRTVELDQTSHFLLTAPVATSMAARRWRFSPPMFVKAPPAYRRGPARKSGTSASSLFVLGGPVG